ncbi:zinc finger MYM-type protein 1 [Trichonephila clavipes]|nr:zinc finger MYM-type protein 1 [Trichonephila clavipes]
MFFFSIILDTIQDILKKDQLSIIIRYVTTDVNDNNEPDSIRINETFLGLIEAANQTAKSLESDVLNFLNTLDMNLAKCRGQGYDGAANMSGVTATAGSDVVQSGRPIFDDFFQHLWPYIGNNTANVVFQMVKRLWLISIDQ